MKVMQILHSGKRSYIIHVYSCNMTKKTTVVWLDLGTKNPWLSFGKDHNLG